jgi:Icc-related predicted phosphoesterase
MTLKVLHSSDLHGSRRAYKSLLRWSEPFDVWVDTGDFFPTSGRNARGAGPRIEPGIERAHQIRWWRYKDLGRRLTEWLDGRPVICVSGNHDFLNLSTEVMWIDGEWAGEQHDFLDLVQQTMASDPDMLVTHAPPAGIADGYDGYGIPPLTTALTYREHRVRYHFYGHAHEHGGRVTNEMGICFVNGACRIALHEVQDRS